jgi:uncharacterized repeat protein (TIGR01451 family)
VTDTATVSGTYTDDAGVGTPVGATDEADYTGVVAGVSIDKQVSVDGTTWLEDGKNVIADLHLLPGDPVYYRVVVDNTGDTPLTISVSDLALQGIVPSGSFLFGGQSTVTIGAHSPLISDVAQETAPGSGTQLDQATVTGTFTDDGHHTAIVTDSDTAGWDVAQPSVTIDKQVSVDGGQTWLEVGPGGLSDPTLLSGTVDPEYRFVVTNTGNVDLSNLTITDSQYGNINIPIASLASNGGTLTTDPVTEAWQHAHVTDTATVSGTYTDDAGVGTPVGATDQADYTGVTMGVSIDKQISVDGGIHWLDVGNGNLSDAAAIAVGGTVEFRVVVTNTSTDVSETVSVSDANPAGTFTFNVNDTSVMLAPGASITSNVLTTSALANAQSDTATASATATDSGGHIGTLTATDQAKYTGGVPGAFQGLTKGFWANHQYVWDGDGAANTGDNWWSGTAAPKTNIYGNEGQLYFGANNHNNVISGPNDLNPVKFLLLGDLNNDGVAGDAGGDLKFDFTAAQALLNSSTSADARVILTSQALATQLNDYNIPGEPNGMIEAAVKWLTTSYSAGHLSGGNVDTNGNGVLDANEYSVAKNGSISFTSPSLSSSSNAFQSVATAAGDVGVYTDPNTHVTYEGSGNGLANALNAFNNGQIVLDSTGQYIEWAGTNSWVHNDKGAFWEVAYGHVGGIIHT